MPVTRPKAKPRLHSAAIYILEANEVKLGIVNGDRIRLRRIAESTTKSSAATSSALRERTRRQQNQHQRRNDNRLYCFGHAPP